MPADSPRDELPTSPVTHDGTVRTLDRSDRSAEPELGRCLGQFRVEERIGQGGLGIVYRAYDEKLARPVALKVLLEGTSSAAAHLLAEARTAASLVHPSIAAIHDVQQQDGIVFIVMELVPGETLRAVLRRGPVAADVALGYTRDIAAGLARAHSGGIVHRDLKPGNVMITPAGAAKILDFGLAREAPDAPTPSSKAAVTGIAGTPGYMAPEQARGDRVDARADVFALGVVVYEMLSGKRPFAPVPAGHARQHDEWKVLAPLAEVAPRAPRPLVAIVERCLAVHRADRFADGGEVLGALRALGPARRPARIGVRVTLAAGAAAVVALGVVALRPRVETGTPFVARGAATSIVDDAQAAALHDELVQARKAWHAGNAAQARRGLEAIVHEVEQVGARSPSPLARVAGEATMVLGEIDESELTEPAAVEPKSWLEMDPAAFVPTQNAALGVATTYSKITSWGVPDLTVCATYRAGRVWERLDAMARAVAARDLDPARRPIVDALYPGGTQRLQLAWAPSLRSYRPNALANYDAAVAMARFVDGRSVDPEDGTDCRAAALARRDALLAMADVEPSRPQ